MAFRKSANQASFHRGVKRATDWQLATLSSGYVTVAANSKVLIASIGSSALAGISPATIVRTRGMLSVASDQSAAPEAQIGGFGVGFVNEVARALGVTALPGPVNEALWDGWFVHQFFQQRFEELSQVGFDTTGAIQYVIDSKAMRKFESDEGLVFMVENNATTGFQVALQLRLLVKAG